MVGVMLTLCWDITSSATTGVSFSIPSDNIVFTRSLAERHPADNGEGYAVRFKFAFQYCGEGDPWWIKYPSFPRKLLSCCARVL